MNMRMVGLLLGFAVMGCAHNNESSRAGESTTTTTTAAQPVSNDNAINDITSARCNRELSCNNIGTGARYGSVDACTREIEHDTRATLRADECPNGISNPDLSSCLNDIRNERCGNPIDTVERVASCRKGKLCR